MQYNVENTNEGQSKILLITEKYKICSANHNYQNYSNSLPTLIQAPAAKLYTLFWHSWPTLYVTCPFSVRARATIPQTLAASNPHVQTSSNIKHLQSGNQYRATPRRAYKQTVPGMFNRPRWHREQGQNAAAVQTVGFHSTKLKKGVQHSMQQMAAAEPSPGTTPVSYVATCIVHNCQTLLPCDPPLL